MGVMILRFASPVLLSVLLLSGPSGPARADVPLYVPEAMLRAKPAAVLVVAEVSAEVTVACGSGPTKVAPAVLRETGTRRFVVGDGWVLTNVHGVRPDH